MATDDRQLLRRLHAGHEASARTLWNEHAGWMRSYARSVLGRELGAAADDVVQAVFCRVLTLDRGTIRAVREVRPWLARLTRREALNQARGASRSRRRDTRAARDAALHRDATAPTDTTQEDELRDALDALPRRLREVVHLRYVMRLTVEQTASALRVPRGTVSSRSDAAISQLRGTLGLKTYGAPDSHRPGTLADAHRPGAPTHVHAR